ncbi:MAG: release factor glutamine methyltransferase [Micavibrio sp.]|nr:MAG: release factor glutamine methyltransferase [Micavibrio sp.]
MKNLYKKAQERLATGAIDSPDLDARLIIKAVLNVADADFITCSDISVSDQDNQTIELMIERRLAGEPVSRILGEREFWGLSFKITPDVLDPRPDTETIIEAALKRFGARPPQSIVDLGTGSGCILIALLHEWPSAQGVAVDVSENALSVAKENAERHKVADRIRFVEGDWGQDINESFDLIVSNPPYIPQAIIPNLAPEVQNHDPILALQGGEDGLQAYRAIFSQLKPLMNEDAVALFEIGYDQQNDVVRLAEESRFSIEGIYADLAGNQRVVEISSGDN